MTILFATRMAGEERLQWLSALRAALPAEDIVDARDDDAPALVDVAIVADPPPGALAGLTSLRLIQSLWAGVDALLNDPTVPVDVPLARLIDPTMSAAMAETAVWAVLSVHRDFVDYGQQQRMRTWRAHEQRRASEVPVLVLGAGHMGRAVAGQLAALGYPVTVWSTRTASLAGVRSCHGEAALAAALAQSIVVVNVLPLTPGTRGLINEALLRRLPSGASVVNLGRGAHVVEADLLAALDRGQLRHAVLDVFAAEPLAPAHPFWSHPRVTVLPHVAAQTDMRSAVAIAAANLQALRAGQPVAHLVDRQRGY